MQTELPALRLLSELFRLLLSDRCFALKTWRLSSEIALKDRRRSVVKFKC